MIDCELKDREFRQISKLVYDICGIDLHEGKKELIKARLGKRLRKKNFRSFSEYYRYVTSEDGTDELTIMIDSISTNLTHFFREDKHFEKLKNIVSSPSFKTRRNGFSPKIMIWSAGCSTGEEPYTIAMVLAEIFPAISEQFKIIATDISTSVLKKASAGIYPANKVNSIPPAMLRKYFLKGHGDWEGYYRVKDILKKSVEIVRCNLKEPMTIEGSFDVIFCRNVMIYFDKQMQSLLIGRFYDYLKDGGYLFIGHSESLTGTTHRFKYIEPSVYYK